MKAPIRSFVEEYLGEMLQGNAAIFAGAGLSAPAGFVDWRQLVRPLSVELELDPELENDFVAVAQFHVNANGKNRHRLHTAIIEALSPDIAPTHNHKLLVQLPISTWWTTNYDKLIEKAFYSAGKITDVKSAVAQLATTRPKRDATIYKMHGDVDRPDEAVATRDDFEKYGLERGAFINALAGDLISKTFLFLGFSFTDPNLEHVLSRVRLTFKENQRRHFAVFRSRTKLHNESDAQFNHFRVRQGLVIEDLKRFNVKVLMVDDYDEIREFIQELVNRYRRRTVFVSASAASFEPWGEAAVQAFSEKLGQRLASNETRIATGLGQGVGNAFFTGALREVIRSQRTVEESIIPRPFPQSNDPDELPRLWNTYRREIVSHSGIALFLFGNKENSGAIANADGLRREFEIARAQGVVLLPIGATGSMAAELAQDVLNDPEIFLSAIGEDAIERLRALNHHTDDLDALVEPIAELIQIVQRGNA